MKFSDLIYPITTELFFSEYFEKKPLVLHRKSPDFYQQVATLKAFNTLLTSHDLYYPGVKLASMGNFVHPLRFTEPAGEGMPLRIKNSLLMKEFHEGKSIVIDGVNNRMVDVADFSRVLEEELKITTRTNAYISPAFSKGFDIHCDNHDVFILQCHGTKVWNIYDQPRDLPSDAKREDGAAPKDIKRLEVLTLQQGDLLYLPRGYYHQANTEESVSAHLTVGLYPEYGYKLFKKLAAKAYENPFFRKAVLSDALDNEVYFADLKREMLRCVEQLSRHDLQLLMAKKEASKDLWSESALMELEPHSILRNLHRGAMTVEINKFTCDLVFAQQRISLPLLYQGELQCLTNVEQVAVLNLIAGQEKLSFQLAKRLLKEGFFEILC